MRRGFYNILWDVSISQTSEMLLTAHAKMCIVGHDRLLKEKSICVQYIRKMPAAYKTFFHFVQ